MEQGVKIILTIDSTKKILNFKILAKTVFTRLMDRMFIYDKIIIFEYFPGKIPKICRKRLITLADECIQAYVTHAFLFYLYIKAFNKNCFN